MAMTDIYMSRADVAKIDETNVRQLYDKFDDILDHRQMLWDEYEREADVQDALMSVETYNVFAPIARYATNIAAGYFIGKPCKYYSRTTQTAKSTDLPNGGRRVAITTKDTLEIDEKKRAEVEQYLASYRAILRRNHEDEENMNLARDCLIHRVAFERVYAVKENGRLDIRFTSVDPKKAVLIKDTSVERKPVAFISREEFIDPFTDNSMVRYEVITHTQHRFYEYGGENVPGSIPYGTDKNGDHAMRVYSADEQTLNLEKIIGLPIVEYKMPEDKGFYEDCIPLMKARDALLNNLRNTFKYNDEAILLMIGYMKPSSDAELEELREQIDKYKMMFLGEDNKIQWLLKDMPIESITGYYNILSQDIFGMLGIKNPVKQSEVYQNITTVRYQNYGMENTIVGMERSFERSLLEGRAQMITSVMNFLGKTNWDWEVLDVAFERNLPTSRTEEAQFIAQMKAAEILADEDILDQVSFIEDTDAAVMRKRRQDERQAESMANIALRAANPHALQDDDVTNDKRTDDNDGRLQRSRQTD